MFNVYEIFEYLLREAFDRKTIAYSRLYEKFNLNAEDRIKLAIFHNYLESAERRIVKDVLEQDEAPIYTAILYRKFDLLPGDGFYDVFMNRNRDEFQKIVGNMTINDVCKNIEMKKKILNKAMEFLRNDLNMRFPDEESLCYFIEEVKLEQDIEVNRDLEILYLSENKI